MVVNETTKNLIVMENIRANKPGFANSMFKIFTTELNSAVLLFNFNPVQT
jgi:hypothetical protein